MSRIKVHQYKQEPAPLKCFFCGQMATRVAVIENGPKSYGPEPLCNSPHATKKWLMGRFPPLFWATS